MTEGDPTNTPPAPTTTVPTTVPSAKEDNPVPAKSGASEDIDEHIPHPTLELYRHTALRGANLGSVVSLFVAPPYLFYKGVRSPMEMLRRTASITAKGMALGIAFGVVSTFLRIRNNKEEQVYDRCYRLRYNSGQVRTDKFTYGGLVLGGVGGVAAKLAAGPLVSGVQGASLGAGLAVFAHVLTKPKAKN